MSDKTQRLEIVTPEKKAYSEDIRFIIVPAKEGEIAFLPEHAAYISPLRIGQIRFDDLEGKRIIMTVSGGFVEVRNSRVTILATAVERVEDIDPERAEAAKQRAEQRLSAKTPELDVLRAEMALKRAINRLSAVGR